MSDFNEIKNDSKTRMEKTIESLKGEFGGLRAGRAHVSLLDGIMVEAYGSMTPLSQVGTVSTPDARTLSVSVWDRSLAKAVEKAIMESDLGLNPSSDGQLIRIPIPPLSEERRKELVGEGHRFFDAMRNNETIVRYTSTADQGWQQALTEEARSFNRDFYKTLLPVPEYEMNANPEMKQNPGY